MLGTYYFLYFYRVAGASDVKGTGLAGYIKFEVVCTITILCLDNIFMVENALQKLIGGTWR
jgi:hypothetical protein